MTTKQELYNELSTMVAKISAATAEATAFADKHGLEFSFPAPTYGMGGYYTGKGHPDFNESSEDAGWSASSQSC